ncbi:MAG: Uma2 family endonuclease [Anaerolineae bacterium]
MDADLKVGIAPHKLITGEEFAEMGDIGSYELIAGRVVPMTPTGGQHSSCEGNIYAALRDYARSRKQGKALVGEVGIYTHRNPDTVRGADVVFVSGDIYTQGFLEGAPDLVVEVTSPNDRWSMITKKLREYFSIGVRLVWVADTETRAVYAFRSLTSLQVFNENDILTAEDVLPGFSLPVAAVFEE